MSMAAHKIRSAGVVFLFLLFASCVSKGFVSRSGLSSRKFHTEIDGRKVRLYRLHNASGMEVCVTNYGGRIVSVYVPDREGRYEDVVCGFDNIHDYWRIRQNFGSVVGRYIGRITNARCIIEGVEYKLQAGVNGHCMHGGYPGFADRVWRVKKHDERSLHLEYFSPDGENGFPGNLLIRVVYTLDGDNALSVSYEASTDKPTVLNPSNHSFFNLSGDLSHSVLDASIRIFGDSIAEYNSDKCMTGRFLPVANTPFDFREYRKMGERIDVVDAQLGVTGGYDHAWKLNREKHTAKLHKAGIMIDEGSGRTMEVYTTEPALHIYTANGHKGKVKGKRGVFYPYRNSVCFETMHFADSPNQPHFPTTLLRPGEKFLSETVFKFGVSGH